MAEQKTSYDAIVRVEIAIEILNQACAIVTPASMKLDEQDSAAAEQLRGAAPRTTGYQRGLHKKWFVRRGRRGLSCA